MRRLSQFLLLSIMTVLGGIFANQTAAAPAAAAGPYRIYIPSVTSVKVAAIAPSSTLNPQEVLVISLIDLERQRAGCLTPLVVSPQLPAAARGHSLDMAVKDFVSHSGSDGTGPSQRASRAGYTGFVGGEILGVGYTSPAAVVQGWLNSPGHKAIMLNCDLKEVGAGFVYDAQDGLGWKYYWTVVFGIR